MNDFKSLIINTAALICMLTSILFPKSMVGNTDLETLALPTGAENTALGEAGVSLSNSPYSVFWNPANIPALYNEYKCRVMYSYFPESLGAQH